MSDDPDLDTAYALETPEDNLRLYRAWAETYDAEFVAGTTYRMPDAVAAAFISAGGGWPCLDVGCGTGAVAERLPANGIVDGVDLSPEMLAVAARKGLYRALFEANLKETLDLPDAAYGGIVSSGTFTHGHVGPEALPELVRVMAPGGVALISVRPEVWTALSFGEVFEALAGDGLVTPPELEETPIYADPTKAPEGHGADTALLVRFTRL